MQRSRPSLKSVDLPKGDLWPEEREGFSEQLVLAYAPVRIHPVPRPNRLVKAEKRIGFWIACAGFAYEAFAHQAPLSTTVLTTAPVIASAAGLALWLHAKWRRSVKRD